MTERKKLGLTKPATPPDEATTAPGYRKPPVRGAAAPPRKRMTAEEAAQARAEAAERAAEAAARAAQAQPVRRDAPPRPQQGPQRQPGDRYEQHGRRDVGPGRHRADDNQRHAEPGRPGQGRQQDRAMPQDRGRAPDRHQQRHDTARPPAATSTQQHSPRPQATAEPAEQDGRVRLSKLMSERGLSSRREADEWIEQGWVLVDGQVVSELGTRIHPSQVITIDPTARTQQAQRVTILLNKPIGYVSGQAEDGYEPAIVLIHPENRWSGDHLPLQLTRGHLRNLAPAGRLDIDSTGMLVLTQDGRVAKQLIGEDSGVEKEYLVRVQLMAEPDAADVSALLPPEEMDRLRFGLELDGHQLKPARVSWQNEQQLRIVLREGRKRQIRRMCEQVGLKVTGLKRVRMGRIPLGDLPIGQWRFLRPDERF